MNKPELNLHHLYQTPGKLDALTTASSERYWFGHRVTSAGIGCPRIHQQNKNTIEGKVLAFEPPSGSPPHHLDNVRRVKHVWLRVTFVSNRARS